MGKSRRLAKRGGGDPIPAAAPLVPEEGLDREERGEPLAEGKRKAGRKDAQPDFGADDQFQFMEEGTSSKILKQAREQINEEETGTNNKSKRSKAEFVGLPLEEGEEAPWDSEEEGLEEDGEDYEPPDVDPSQERAFNQFLCVGAGGQARNLADIIQESIDKKRRQVDDKLSVRSVETRDLDPRLVEMLHGVRDVLKTYTSGRLPKIFKIIPKLVNWEQVLQVTEPDMCSSAAIYQGTRIFVSNLSAKMCQRYLHYVLLPRVRDDIQENKKLNFHLYQALFKSLFKPAAFFKGILIPICESGTCSLREATIIGSVLRKCKVPMLHSAAAMLKIAEMQYSGANSLFLRVLLEKKYTLPFRVLDGLVHHLVSFTTDTRHLPVLWHQALLALVQYYKNDISEEQSGTCSLREATIIGSVLTKCKVPMLHSAAAMLKIAEMQYSGANSLFLRVLLEKKYALPFRVLDGLVHHLVSFTTDTRHLPVLWHQALLALVQYYKNDISEEQREALLKLVQSHNHYVISDIVRRELQHAHSRDIEDQMGIDMD